VGVPGTYYETGSCSLWNEYCVPELPGSSVAYDIYTRQKNGSWHPPKQCEALPVARTASCL